MKKTIAILLLTSIVLSGVLVAFITGAYMKYSLEMAVEDSITELHRKLEPVFVVFDKLIEREENNIQKRMEEALPVLHQDLIGDALTVKDVPDEKLEELVEKYKFSEGYLVNSAGVIFKTTYSPDKNFNLNDISKGFSEWLSNVYGQGKVITDRLVLSTKTGVLNIYGYYSPKGSDTITEVSVNIREYMEHVSGVEYVNFVFQTLFESAMQSNAKVLDVDLFMYNELAAWSVLHESRALDNDIRIRLIQEPQVRIKFNNQLVVYSRFKPTHKPTFFTQDFCTKVIYDISDLNTIVRNFTIYAVLCMILILPIIYMFISKSISKRIIEPIGSIVDALEAIKDGKYDMSLDIKSVPEVETIAAAVNNMQSKIVLREQALEDAKQKLEQRVLDRTKNLEDARYVAEKLAQTDMLTGMPNRRYFYEKSEEAFKVSKRYNRPLSAIMMDIDHFKKTNDTYGHAAGDKVLIEVAKAIKSASRDIDITGRIGGEEFAIVIPETPSDNAVDFAERLRKLISVIQIYHEDTKISLTCSFGVSGRSEDCESLDDLLAKADLALYEAKGAGRDRVEFHQSSDKDK